jgi:hypothetical protein
MTRHVLLNNIDHRNVRIDTGRGAGLGDDVMFAPTFPGEFRNVQAHYPIVFRRLGTGGHEPVALFGLQQRRNLFLDGERWDAHYVPLAVERQPFLIGMAGDALQVLVDMDSPRVREDVGEALFREHGGTTPFLEHVRSLLLALHDGLQDVAPFVAALEAHRLLESFVLDVECVDGSQSRLSGFLTIDEARVRALDDAAVVQLHRRGHLEAIHMAMASMAQFRGLIERGNRAVAAGR